MKIFKIKKTINILLIFLILINISVKAIDGYRVQDVYANDNNKIVFLTFDDGPSKNTSAILDILKDYKIKATFFVLGVEIEKNPDILIRMYKEGHSIGNHTYSHLTNVNQCTPENFIKDLEKNKELINETLKVDLNVNLIRFPYGSTSKKYINKKLYVEKLRECNLKAIDWNVDSKDSIERNPSKNFIMNKIIEQSKNKTRIVLLMHDSVSKKNTVSVLPEVIEYFLNNGYSFEKIASEQD